MSTTIEITCGGTVKVQPITHSICRIGSHAGLELCMPGIEGHMATLRILNGKRLIYNRSAKPIRLNGKVVQPEQTMEWAGNQVLELADGVSLRLLSARAESKAMGAGASAQADSPEKCSANPSTPATTQDQKQRRMAILGFLLVFATILFYSDSGTSDKGMDQEFAQVIYELIRAEREANGGRCQQLRVELQNAMLRSDLKPTSIQRVKQILAAHSSEATAAIDERIRKLVEVYF